MFEELLSFHEPSWKRGARYYAREIFHLYQLGLLEGPRYPKGWFAREWEDTAIEIIVSLNKQYDEVTAEAFSAALEKATSEAEGTYS